MIHYPTREEAEVSARAAMVACERRVEALAAEAREKEKRRREWEERNEPCPHCGRRDDPPEWLR